MPVFLVGAALGTTRGAGPRNHVPENSGRSTPGEETRLTLVELFTSQGCSSCPPADRLLGTISERPGIIPLAYHVDYWNHLGWADPFSSERWSERQRRYGHWFDEDTIYTPQLVVGGTRHAVGSDRRAVEHHLDAARGAGSPASAPRIDVSVEHRPGRVDARVRAEAQDFAIGHVIRVALYERHLEVRIRRGENSGRTLHYDYVVRDLELLRSSGTVTFRLETDWKAADLGVVAFVQDESTGAVLAVARSAAPGVRSTP